MQLTIGKKQTLYIIIVGLVLLQDTIYEFTNNQFINYFDECLILLLGVYSFTKNRKVDLFSRKVIFYVVLFALCGICSGLLNSLQYIEPTSFLMGCILMVKFFLCLLFVYWISPRASTIERITNGIIFWGYVNAVIAIPNILTPQLWKTIFPVANLSERFGITSVAGLFIHSGQYGWFMAFVSFIFLAKYMAHREKKELTRFFFFAFFALLSLKAKVIISIALVLLYVFFVIEKNKMDSKKMTFIILVVPLAVIIAGEYILDTFNMYFTAKTGVSARYGLLYNAFEIVKNYFPFGVGFGKYGSFYAKVNYSEYYYMFGLDTVYGLSPSNPSFATDTFWPAILGETGALGTLVYCLNLKFIFKRLKNNMIKYKSFYSYFGIFVMLQALAESLGEPIFNSSPQNICIAISVAFSLAMIRRKDLDAND